MIRLPSRPCAIWVLSLALGADALAAPHAQMMDTTDALLAQKSSAYARTEMGLFREALDSAESAVRTAQDRYGVTHPSVAPYLIDLATLQRAMARFKDAESNLKWALALRERAYGPKNSSVREVLGHLAALYDDQGRWEEAEFFAQRALSLCPQASEEGRDLLSRLGGIRFSQGDLAQARRDLGQSLGPEKRAVVDADKHIMNWTLLAKVQLGQKKPLEAEESLQKTLAFARQSFPGKTMEVGVALEDLGDFYLSQNRPEKAKACYEEGLAILKLFVGVNYEFSALIPLQNLSRAYQATGNHVQAKDLLEKALATSRQAYDPGHPRIGNLLLALARSEKALGASKEAKQHAKEALGIFQNHFDPRHPLVLKAQSF